MQRLSSVLSVMAAVLMVQVFYADIYAEARMAKLGAAHNSGTDVKPCLLPFLSLNAVALLLHTFFADIDAEAVMAKPEQAITLAQT